MIRTHEICCLERLLIVASQRHVLVCLVSQVKAQLLVPNRVLRKRDLSQQQSLGLHWCENRYICMIYPIDANSGSSTANRHSAYLPPFSMRLCSSLLVPYLQLDIRVHVEEKLHVFKLMPGNHRHL